jgi:enoyl-CoA hydratase/carnithine racemase
MSDILEISREGRVLRVALNRPEKRNALSAELCAAIVNCLDDADADTSVGAILLCANGKAFCAGMDLAELGVVGTDEINRVQEKLFTVGSRLSKPIVAVVNGPALGGGMGLVANCHIAVAGENASFGLTEIRLGLWPFLVYRAVAAALGERRTTELSLTGRVFGPAEAKEMGLVQEISSDPGAAAMKTASAIASFSPTAIATGLRLVRDSRELSFGEAGEHAKKLRNVVFESDDFKEGVRAFLEKRPPNWPSLGREES